MRKIILIIVTAMLIALYNPKTIQAYSALTVNKVYDDIDLITGKAQKNSRINLEKNGEILESTVTGESNDFYLFVGDFPDFKAGDTLTIIVIHQNREIARKNIKVLDRTPPEPPRFFTIFENTGNFKIDGEPRSTVYLQTKNQLITSNLDNRGTAVLEVPKLNVGEQVSIYLKDSANNKSEEVITKVKESKIKPKKQASKRRYYNNENTEIQKAMISVMKGYALKNKLAFIDDWQCDEYFRGDCYITVGNDKIQTKDMDSPGYYAFSKHIIGGFIIYKPKNNKYGYTKLPSYQLPYYWLDEKTKPKTDIETYLLADDGRVYVSKVKKEKYTERVNFGVYTWYYNKIEYSPKYKFEVNKKNFINENYQKIIKKYN